MQHIRTVLDHDFEYIGGDLSTDFANTQSFRFQPAQAHDHLGNYADLVDFGRQAGALSPALARRLLAAAQSHPNEAAQIYRRAIALREAIWQSYSRIGHGKSPTREDIDLISREAAAARGHARFVPTRDGFVWEWSDSDDLGRALWPIASAATEVLGSATTRADIRECADDVCAWLFLDRSKSHTRRWCDMKTCGNRAKQRRFTGKTSSPVA